MRQLLNEINRYKQLMGIVLITEAGKSVDDYLPLTPKAVDNLTKNGVDFTNDLTKLSDEFAKSGIKTFTDLSNLVAKKQNISINNVTDEMIRNYIKNDEELYSSILAKSNEAASKQVDGLIKNVSITKIFSQSQLNSYSVYIGTPPSSRNIEVLTKGLSDSIDEIEKMLGDIQTGKIPGINTVPNELSELYDNLLWKKAEVDEFRNRKSNPTPSKNSPTEVKWGKLGNGFAISDRITYFVGRYVVMVKDANGRLRPFYQRTGGGGVDQGWASAGNWVPFYGIADVTLNVLNKETNQYELRRIDGWFIKPENGRMGESGDETISKLIGDVAGTNGIKDVDYGFGNLSKSISNTSSNAAMNGWLRSFGYEITPNSGWLKTIKPPNILHGIP